MVVSTVLYSVMLIVDRIPSILGEFYAKENLSTSIVLGKLAS